MCDFEAVSREQLAGHRSGHVRRGELAKRSKERITEFPCSLCDKTFASKCALVNHSRFHTMVFENLKNSGTRKAHLIAKRGRRCEKCGITEWCGQPAPITIDHIDGNSDHNSESNLRLLCPNCHAQTPTFAGKNMGRFPSSKRSHQMKTYRVKMRATTLT